MQNIVPMTRPALELRTGQHLTLTPQLQQSIRLLQLSTLDLQTEISQALADNPMLERSDEPADAEPEAPAERETSMEDEAFRDTEPRNEEMPGSGGVYPDGGPDAARRSAACRSRRRMRLRGRGAGHHRRGAAQRADGGNSIGTSRLAATGSPSRVAGRKRHFATAAIAARSSTGEPLRWTMRLLVGTP